jgi:hypothetical protein
LLITAFFSDQGAPKTGLSPTIRIRNAITTSLVVTDAAMTEIGDGWYKYDFAGYDPTIDYVIRSDGGALLANHERYSYGNNENYIDDIDSKLVSQHGAGSWQENDNSLLALESSVQAVKSQTDQMTFSGSDIQARVNDKGVLNDPTSATIASDVWDEVLTSPAHNVISSAGRRLRELEDGLIIHSGLAQDGDNNFIQLDASASPSNETYLNMIVTIIAGGGAGQSRRISSYNGISKRADVSQSFSPPASFTSQFIIIAGGASGLASVEPQAVSELENAIWNADLSGHPTPGSSGLTLSNAAVQSLVDTSFTTVINHLTDIKGAGWTNENLTVMDALLDGIKAVTDLLPDGGALTTLINHLTDIKGGGWTAESLVSLDALLTLVDAKTTNLPVDPASQSSVETAISTSENNIRGSDSDDLKTLSDQIDLSALETTLLAVKAKTDILTFNGTNIEARVNDKGVLNDPSETDIDSVLTAQHGAGSWVTSPETGVALEATSQDILQQLVDIKGENWDIQTLVRIYGLLQSTVSYINLGPGTGTETVQGRITNAQTGESVEGAWVRVLDLQTLIPFIGVRTNATGNWEVFVDPGTYIFAFDDEDYNTQEYEVTIPDNGGVPIDWDDLTPTPIP